MGCRGLRAPYYLVLLVQDEEWGDLPSGRKYGEDTLYQVSFYEYFFIRFENRRGNPVLPDTESASNILPGMRIRCVMFCRCPLCHVDIWLLVHFSYSRDKQEFHIESIERIRNLEMDEKEYVLLKAIIVCDPSEHYFKTHILLSMLPSL